MIKSKASELTDTLLEKRNAMYTVGYLLGVLGSIENGLFLTKKQKAALDQLYENHIQGVKALD